MSYYIMNSGRKIYAEDITIDDICLHDIAHHLTKICRFGGTLPLDTHYSVAEHCVHLYNYCVYSGYDIETQKAVLMHDASEAYLGDVISVIKAQLPCYQKLEKHVESLIREKYNLTTRPEVWTQVRALDSAILLDEAQQLMPDYYHHFAVQMPDVKPLGIKLPYTYIKADSLKTTFLEICKKLNLEV